MNELVIPHYITRSFMERYKETHFFVYADDATLKSFKGQAEEGGMTDNACSITTKLWNCRSTQSYFHDDLFELDHKLRTDTCIERILTKAAGRRIILFPLIGQGYAELPQRAPRTLAYIQKRLQEIAL